MYRVAVCEDEVHLRRELNDLCREILTQMEVEHSLAMFSSAEEMQDAINMGRQFDLLCLDILMPGQSGMELAHQLRRRDDRTSIIFITSSEEFLREGYSVRPIQYLMKPVSREELEEALRTDLRLHHQPSIVTVTAGGKMTAIPLKDILYVESRDHRVVFVLERGEESFWLTLSKVEGMLPTGQFCRCHNSFLVNLAKVTKMESRDVVLAGGRRLAVSRGWMKEFQTQLTRFLGGGGIQLNTYLWNKRIPRFNRPWDSFIPSSCSVPSGS